MNSDDLNIQDYVKFYLSEMNDLYGFEGKTIFLVFMEPNLDIARYIIRKNATKVYFMNPDFTSAEHDDGKIIALKHCETDVNIPARSIDLVMGAEILEHIKNISGFFTELKRILKNDGNIELQGSPLWTSPFGHHIWLQKFKFYEESNPFEPWEHLLYKNETEAKEALTAKGLTEQDAVVVSKWVYGDKEISRLSPSEIISDITGFLPNEFPEHRTISGLSVFERYLTNGFEYEFKRVMTRVLPNEHFEKAAQYSQIDKNTVKLIMKSHRVETKKEEEKTVSSVTEPDLPECISDIFNPFTLIHNPAGKKVLNLSTYYTNEITETFKARGAELVVCENIENNKTEEKFDIIFGIDALKNAVNPDLFFKNIKNCSTPDCALYLDCYLPFTSYAGHKIQTEKFNYTDNCPLEPWEHLCSNDKSEFAKSLKNKGLRDTEVNEIVDCVFESKSEKYSPSELKVFADKHLNLFSRGILTYRSENKFYTQALRKYSSSDLNTERLIFTSDFPKNELPEDLEINKYLKQNIISFHERYNFEGKKVLSLSPFVNFCVTEMISLCGASETVSFGPYYSGFELKNSERVRFCKQNFEDIENLQEKFDIIYAIDILEHLKDPAKFYENLKRLIKPDGIIFLQGSPLWASDNGHNINIILDSGPVHSGDETNPFEPWEYLAYKNKDSLTKALTERGKAKKDAEKIAAFVFESDEINRLPLSKHLAIIEKIEGITVGMKKILQFSEENTHYAKASEKYSHEDLKTKELKLYIRLK